VEALVVDAEERELDTREFTFGDIGLCRPEAELAHLLPVDVGRLTGANAGDREDLRADVVLRGGRSAERGAERSAGR
jgi:hypothetical protein